MISVVIPVLNEETFLPGCLESLRNQDYGGEYEVIVADNGSSDDSASIARSSGARVISCPGKNDVFYAREAGARAAHGDIIVQADADTIYPSSWLTRIAEQFATHPEAVAVAGRFAYRDPTFWAKPECFLRNAINKLTRAISGIPLLVSGATFAFRRSAFLAVNGYEGITYSPDQYGIARRLRRMGEIVYDSDLRVLTSSRSVQKPSLVLARDLLVHIGRFTSYLSKNCFGRLKVSSNKTPARRVASRVVPGVMVVLLFAVYGYFIPASPVFGKVYSKGSPAEKVVALTFDDGPNEPYTSEILDILDRYHIKATFFAIGKNVELYPDTAKRMLDEGNVIGNHSYSHNANHALTLSGVKDMETAQMAIFLVLGVTPHLYRGPHGKKSPWELMRAKKDGLIDVAWSVSTGELHVKSADTLAQRIVAKTDPGEIILLHDGYGTEHNNANADKSLIVRALPLIIEQLQAKGYRFVTVPQLLGVPAYNN